MTPQGEIHGFRNNNGLRRGAEPAKDLYPLLKSLRENINKGAFGFSEGKTHNAKMGSAWVSSPLRNDLVFAQGRHVWLNHGTMSCD